MTQTAPATPAADQPAPRTSPGAFLRRHWLITLLLLAATIVRLIVMLAYPPAFWYPDSLPYISAALHPAPYTIRPIGYSFLLILLEPLHSVLLVAAIQHAMGLAMAIEVYILLRRYKLPAWGCALAAAPPLFNASGIQIEHYVLSDTLFGFLVTTALVLVLWRPRPRIWVCGLAGLLLAWAVLARSQGMLVLIPFLLYLATARLGIRRAIASAATMCVAAFIPVAAYAWWFDRNNGTYQMTTSTGAFLYSRVASFAQCPIIKPPANERWLCLATPVSKRETVAAYAWEPSSPIHRPPPALGSEFGNDVNSLATNFALRAITAQPAAYLKVVWSTTLETFMPLRDTNYSYSYYVFPSSRPMRLEVIARNISGNYQDDLTYNGGADPNTQVIRPFAGWLLTYQRYVVLPGPLLGVIVAIGLVGIALAWRRSGGPGALPWLVGAVLIVTPAATVDFDARYVIAAIPAFCIAGALAVRDICAAWRHWSPRLQTAARRVTAGRTWN